MPVAERTLPIAAAHREFTVLVAGEPVPRADALQGLSIVAMANRIASAQLSYVDGVAAGQGFALADSGLFDPGQAIEIRAGVGREKDTLFVGIVIGVRLRMREGAPPLLQVECRHAATRLATARRSAVFTEQTDSDAIESLLSAAGVPADVAGTAVQHAQLVQHDCSDWDFLLARAQACGLNVLTRGDRLVLTAPAIDSPMAELRFGATLLAFEGEVDARLQAQAVQVASWQPAQQAVDLADGSDPGFDAPGSFEPDALAEAAGAVSRVLPHAALDASEAALLADSTCMRAQASLVRGRAKCAGLGTVQPGDTVTLAGLGQRFDGDALVTGVRHDLDPQQGWKTHLQLGQPAPDEAHAQRLQQRRAGALLAPVSGLQCGVVTDIDDPAGEFRVRVRLPLVDAGRAGIWARVATLDAGDERGWVFRPEIDDEVLVGFLDEDPRHPVVLGMLHSSAHRAPIPPDSGNDLKGYRSRSGIELQFDDGRGTLTLRTPRGNTLVLDDAAGGITLEDQHGNRIVVDASGIQINSIGKLAMEAAGLGELKANAKLDLTSSGVVAVSGAQVQLG